LLPLVEAGLFYFTGRLVDILDQAGKGGVERSCRRSCRRQDPSCFSWESPFL
jgi:hypothetical protein